MDENSVAEWHDSLGIPGRKSITLVQRRAGLRIKESKAFMICAAENLRIEQERIPDRLATARLTVG